jgi:hypothetical protein
LPKMRSLSLVAAGMWVIAFILLAPGEPAFGLPDFSYTAALDMTRLSLVIAILAAAIILQPENQSYVRAAAAALAVLAIFTFFFSTRNIVIENASRFFYHALLIAFPLLLGPLIQTWYWLKRRIVYTSHSLIDQAAAWAAVALLAWLLALPSAASVASAHDNLQFKNERVIEAETLQALAWLKQNSPTDAVVMASPSPPWAVPFFTGRSLIRLQDYWLSPPDTIAHQLQAAFAGDKASQVAVLPLADYVFLTRQEESAWLLPLGDEVFRNGRVLIYQH